MDTHHYKYRRIIATIIIFLALAVLYLFSKASAPILWGLLIAGIAEILNDLRG